MSTENPHGAGENDRDSWATALGLPSVWDVPAEMEWLVEDMIPLGGVTLISAPPAKGKAWLAHAIGGSAAHGRPFLGRQTEQCYVLYLDGENPIVIVKRNLEALGIERTDNLQIWGGWNESPPPGPDAPALLKLAREQKPLFIFDSLVYFHDGDEQSATETRKFMNFFRALANAGATVIVLHHPGKDAAKKYRGSSDIEASVDMAYTLDGTKKNGLIDRLTLRCFKSRYGSPEHFTMQYHAGQGFEAVDVPQAADRPEAASVVPVIINAHDGINGVEVKRLAKAQGVSKHAVDAVLATWPNTSPGKGRERLYLPYAAAGDPEREAA